MAKLTFEERKAERLREWKGWVAEFISAQNLYSKSEVKSIPHAAILLNDYYWRVAMAFLRPLLKSDNRKEHNLHYYKIISASELTAMAVMPFYLVGDKTKNENKKLNANFAMFVATTIMLNWKVDRKKTIDVNSLDQVFSHREIIDVIKRKEHPYFLSFKEEHLDWLAGVNTLGPLPVLSNSQTWRLCFFAAKAIFNGGNLK